MRASRRCRLGGLRPIVVAQTSHRASRSGCDFAGTREYPRRSVGMCGRMADLAPSLDIHSDWARNGRGDIRVVDRASADPAGKRIGGRSGANSADTMATGRGGLHRNGSSLSLHRTRIWPLPTSVGCPTWCCSGQSSFLASLGRTPAAERQNVRRSGRNAMRVVATVGAVGLALISSDLRAGGTQLNSSTCVAQQDAIAAAVTFVRHHSREGEFDLKRRRAENWGNLWEVSFAKRDHVVPGSGLVDVRKSDCSAAWVPLK